MTQEAACICILLTAHDIGRDNLTFKVLFYAELAAAYIDMESA